MRKLKSISKHLTVHYHCSFNTYFLFCGLFFFLHLSKLTYPVPFACFLLPVERDKEYDPRGLDDLATYNIPVFYDVNFG